MGDRLVVLLLGKRIDRAKRLTATGEPFDPRLELELALGVQWLIGSLRCEAELRSDVVELVLCLGRRVAYLLRCNLRRCDGLARLAQPRLQRHLLLCAGAQLGGGPLADGLVGRELLGELQMAGPDDLGRLLQCEHRAGCCRRDALTTPDPRAQSLGLERAFALLAGGALSHPPLSGDLGLDTCTRDRGRTLVRRLAPALDQPVGAPDRLACLFGLAERLPKRVLRPLERLVGLLRGALRLRRAVANVLLSLLRCGELGVQLLAAVALGEDLLLAAGRGLAEGSRGAVVDAARFGDGDPCEVCGDAVE